MICYDEIVVVLNIALLALFLRPLMCSQGLKVYATVGSWWCLIGFQRMNMTCSKGLKAYATVGSWWCLVGFQRMNMMCSKGLEAYAYGGILVVVVGGCRSEWGRRTRARKG